MTFDKGPPFPSGRREIVVDPPETIWNTHTSLALKSSSLVRNPVLRKDQSLSAWPQTPSTRVVQVGTLWPFPSFEEPFSLKSSSARPDFLHQDHSRTLPLHSQSYWYDGVGVVNTRRRFKPIKIKSKVIRMNWRMSLNSSSILLICHQFSEFLTNSLNSLNFSPILLISHQFSQFVRLDLTIISLQFSLFPHLS